MKYEWRYTCTHFRIVNETATCLGMPDFEDFDFRVST